ncbi:unnamed protein product [Prunus brigantina]
MDLDLDLDQRESEKTWSCALYYITFSWCQCITFFYFKKSNSRKKNLLQQITTFFYVICDTSLSLMTHVGCIILLS